MKTSPAPTLLRLCGAVLLALSASACSGVADVAPAAPPAPAAAPAPPPLAAATPASGGSLMQQLTAEIGGAACDTAQQCKTVAIGHKACGGPESYLAYSTKAGNGAKVESLAASYAEERRNQNAKSGMMSTCSVVLDPGATCSANRCVTAKPGLGGNTAQ